MIAAALLLAAVQHGGHGAPACTPEHAAMGHCKLPAKAAPTPKPKPVKKPAPTPRAAPAKPTLTPGCTPEHAAMGHCQLPPPAAPTPVPTATGSVGTDLPAGNAPAPPAPRADYADRVFGAGAMRHSRHHLQSEHGGGTFAQIIFNLAEVQIRNGRDGYRWDGEGWFGGDRDRLVVKTEGRGGFGGGVEDAEVQALYSRAVGPYFNLQAGVRHDIRPRPSRTHLALGVEGLAPYWFEVEATAFLSDRGDVSGRIEGYYDQRITQRLVLQPRAELNLDGGSDLELGLRLRYELAREFAPYLGVSWDRELGGGDADVSVVAGVRFWL